MATNKPKLPSKRKPSKRARLTAAKTAGGPPSLLDFINAPLPSQSDQSVRPSSDSLTAQLAPEWIAELASELAERERAWFRNRRKPKWHADLDRLAGADRRITAKEACARLAELDGYAEWKDGIRTPDKQSITARAVANQLSKSLSKWR